MAKETFYFSHDYNARNDPKLVNLMMKHRLSGIGLYWCVIEMMYEQAGYIMHSECERIAFELRTDPEIVKSVFCDFDLFKTDNEKYWSESVFDRIKRRLEKSKSASESANKRWEKVRNAIALPTEYEGNAIKERKEEEKEITVYSFLNLKTSKEKDPKLYEFIQRYLNMLLKEFPNDIEAIKKIPLKNWSFPAKKIISHSNFDQVKKVIGIALEDEFYKSNLFDLALIERKWLTIKNKPHGSKT